MGRVVLGAPVAHREWVLPAYFDAIAAQTVRPDAFLFVHSGTRYDATWQALAAGAALVGRDELTILHDSRPPHQRHDNARFGTLAVLRNTLLAMAVGMLDADVLISLDTDVLLEDRRTIERLLELLDEGWDTASPVTWLHPLGEGSWAYNAGWWSWPAADRQLGGRGPHRPWTRPGPEHVAWGVTLAIDVPMAATAMSRRVLERCRYRWHEAGEDLGFAQDLDRLGMACAWDTTLKARHVWDPTQLEAAPA